MVRTPLLPVDRLPWVREPLRALDDPDVVRALAIGSPTLLQKASRPAADAKEAARTRTSLARYLIRMTTRPTPYGGFAAVSLAGLPLLIAVRRDFLPAWRDFAGDDWLELPVDEEAVERWVQAVTAVAA